MQEDHKIWNSVAHLGLHTETLSREKQDRKEREKKVILYSHSRPQAASLSGHVSVCPLESTISSEAFAISSEAFAFHFLAGRAVFASFPGFFKVSKRKDSQLSGFLSILSIHGP